MQRALLVISLIFFTIASSILYLYIYKRQPVTELSASACSATPAKPDYLSTGSAYDAIAAINNARHTEHLPSLRLPTDFYQLDPAQQQFILLNQERTDRGLHPLRSDPYLAQLALAYSRQLRDLNFFSHTSPISGSFGDRINSNPLLANHYSEAGENLAGNPVPGVGSMYEYMYNDAVESCGHRHNILNPNLTLVGINWLRGGIYGSMSAQEFLTPAPWNPYTGATPDTISPKLILSITSTPSQVYLLQCHAFAYDNIGVTRITWFLDSLDYPLHTGPTMTLNTHHLKPGIHTLLAFAIDAQQNYSRAIYSMKVYQK